LIIATILLTSCNVKSVHVAQWGGFSKLQVERSPDGRALKRDKLSTLVIRHDSCLFLRVKVIK
jgi:hypothetical protein